jgi:bifunctional UDP-N-acetylglucosamine pyrophosphorylase/glucosamine-1-phosphate N-acetyltransferase
MRSELPKALFTVCGYPLVHYPVQAALDCGVDEVVVVLGHKRELVEAYLKQAFGERVRFAVQTEQKGTGDAAHVGVKALGDDVERVIILNGDTPLLVAADLAPVLHALDDDPIAAMALATCELDQPKGYGRVLRDATGHVVAIREERDTKSDEERAVREINPGIYASSRAFFAEALAQVTPNNAQGEYYLTDVVAYAAGRGGRVLAISARAAVMDGVNDRAQLAQAEEALCARILDDWRRKGVTIRAGAHVDASVKLSVDCTLAQGVVLRGATEIGQGAFVDVGCVLTDVVVAAGARLRPYTVAERSSIGESATVGPFSHLRPDSNLGPETHVGNFVEVKKTTMGRGSKANHLAYLGDGQIGERVNVGAGTIFCNYDGFKKHVTTLEDDAFIGSDTQLVAPVTVGKGAYVATGTTVTRNVPADALAISRGKQENKEGYASRLRARMKK